MSMTMQEAALLSVAARRKKYGDKLSEEMRRRANVRWEKAKTEKLDKSAE